MDLVVVREGSRGEEGLAVRNGERQSPEAAMVAGGGRMPPIHNPS